LAEAADFPVPRDVLALGEPVGDPLPGVEDAPDFRGSDDQVVAAAEDGAGFDSAARGVGWYCDAALGLVPPDHGEALGVSIADRRGAEAGAEAPLPKPDG
jgi:hypothetical protein